MARKDPAAVSLGRKGGKAKAANMTADERSEAMRELGRARMANLTKEQRQALARKAVKAREAQKHT